MLTMNSVEIDNLAKVCAKVRASQSAGVDADSVDIPKLLTSD
jgi:hypothetical protein